MNIDKIPMYITIPGNIIINPMLTNNHKITYGLITALNPLKDAWGVTIDDIALMVQIPTTELRVIIKDLTTEGYLSSELGRIVPVWEG